MHTGVTEVMAGFASGTERLDRDVLEQAGVTHVILFMGTNDISKEVSAAQVMAGMQEIIARVKASGLKIIGVTIIPRTRWDGTKTAIRHEVNDWIRHQVGFDTVLDFDWVVRDAANPNVINPLFNCDGVHPNPFGYFVMGQSIDLEILLGLLAARPASGPAPPE
jgi:lysophospholipase L1-like esterase